MDSGRARWGWLVDVHTLCPFANHAHPVFSGQQSVTPAEGEIGAFLHSTDLTQGCITIAGIQFLSPKSRQLQTTTPDVLARDGTGAASDTIAPTALVETASTLKNIRSLALALTLSRPVLLQGGTGSGKTGLVEHLWSTYGQHVSAHRPCLSPVC